MEIMLLSILLEREQNAFHGNSYCRRYTNLCEYYDDKKMGAEKKAKEEM